MDIEDVFDVKAVRGALEARLKSLEAEKQQVERLQNKFRMIHSTLAQQATLQAAPAGPLKQSDLAERMSLMSLTDSVSLSNLSKLRLPRQANSSGSNGPADTNVLRDSTDKLNIGFSAAVGSKAAAGGGDMMKRRTEGAPGALTDQQGAANRQVAGGALAAAAAAAAGGSLSKLAGIAAANSSGGKPLNQQAVGAGSGQRRGLSADSVGHPDGAFTKGVRAHAVNLSTTTLTH
eukprot:GHUV01029771.1.p1 GENE.GHUV01029771.1~~GHUV01029771.1.p1  ORF type:complete len:233 (+),score=108.21 GHUV01029771.1:182-880(+)